MNYENLINDFLFQETTAIIAMTNMTTLKITATTTTKSIIKKMYSAVEKQKIKKQLFRPYDLGNNFNFIGDLNFK